MNRRAVALLAAAMTAGAGGDALADRGRGKAELDAAAAAIDGIDFEAARRHAESAIASGTLSHGQLVRAYRLLGEIAGGLDESGEARDAFLRWVVLDSGASLPPGMSPKITEPFAAAKAEAKRIGSLELAASLRRTAGAVVVTVAPRDPLKLIARLHAQLDGREQALDGGRVELPAADGEAVEIRVVALDRHGNQLVIEQLTAEPRRVDSPPPPPARKRLPAALRWPTWTVSALVAGGAGVFFARRVGQAQDELDALNAESMTHSFDEARAIQDRGERDALIANVSFAVAGVAVVAAAVTFLVDRD